MSGHPEDRCRAADDRVEPDRVAALVLAGGASRRFGPDKTRALLAGRSLLERVIAVVEPHVDDLLIAGPWAPQDRRHTVEPDRFQGPLVALAHALGSFDAEWVLVVGGDHPLVRSELVALLISRACATSSFTSSRAFDAVVPVRAGRLEPLLALYRRVPAAATASRLVGEGERRISRLFDHFSVDRVEEATWSAVDPDGRSFSDVDTPADLVHLDQVLRR